MTDLEKFQEFFKQFGLSLEKPFGDYFQLKGDRVNKSYAMDEWRFTEDGKFKGVEFNE